MTDTQEAQDAFRATLVLLIASGLQHANGLNSAHAIAEATQKLAIYDGIMEVPT